VFVSWVARGVNLGTRINHGRQVPTPDVLHVWVRTRGFQRVLNGVDQATLHAEDNEDNEDNIRVPLLVTVKLYMI